MVLSFPLFVGVAFVAIAGLVLLRRTRWFWLPGVALAGYGVLIYLAWPWHATHADTGGLEGISNVLHVAATFVVVVAGLACVIIGARSRRRARGPAATEIPTAIVKR